MPRTTLANQISEMPELLAGEEMSCRQIAFRLGLPMDETRDAIQVLRARGSLDIRKSSFTAPWKYRLRNSSEAFRLITTPWLCPSGMALTARLREESGDYSS